MWSCEGITFCIGWSLNFVRCCPLYFLVKDSINITWLIKMTCVSYIIRLAYWKSTLNQYVVIRYLLPYCFCRFNRPSLLRGHWLVMVVGVAPYSGYFPFFQISCSPFVIILAFVSSSCFTCCSHALCTLVYGIPVPYSQCWMVRVFQTFGTALHWLQTVLSLLYNNDDHVSNTTLCLTLLTCMKYNM